MIEFSTLQLPTTITADAQLASSLAVLLGAIFVYFQLRQNNALIQASNKQAQAAATQAQLTTEQTKQNNAIADMDILMRLYEFANTAEVQSAWLTVINSDFETEDFESLSKDKRVAFLQITALFESLGVLVKRGFVQLDAINDTFQTELAWTKSLPFVEGMRKQFGDDAGYQGFEGLYKQIEAINSKKS